MGITPQAREVARRVCAAKADARAAALTRCRAPQEAAHGDLGGSAAEDHVSEPVCLGPTWRRMSISRRIDPPACGSFLPKDHVREPAVRMPDFSRTRRRKFWPPSPRCGERRFSAPGTTCPGLFGHPSQGHRLRSHPYSPAPLMFDEQGSPGMYANILLSTVDRMS